MKSRFKIIVPLAIIVACAVFLFFCRSIPVTRIWKNYQVLYVEKAVSEKQVLSVLQDSGCEDVISLSEQQIPLFSPYTPIEPEADSTSYLTNRLEYFTDKSKAYELYYIPESYERQTNAAVSSLTKQFGKKAGLDGKSNYPWIIPVICLALYLFFVLVSKNKKVFAFAGLFPVLFTLSKPFYASAAGVLLLLLALYLAERYWNRKGAVSLLCKNVYTITLCSFALVTVFLSSWRSGMLFILVLCASTAALVLYGEAEGQAEKKRSFTYTLILPAKVYPLMNKKNAEYTLLTSGTIILLLVLFLASARFVPQISVNGLSLPSPVEKGRTEIAEDEMLPSLSDYFVWSWDTITYPYRNLNRKGEAREIARPGDSVTLTQYRNTENGIEAYESTPYVFNGEFMGNAEKNIDSLEYPAVEKLMKKQGRSTAVAYVEKSSGGNTRDGKSLALIIITIGIPLLLYLYYTVTGRRKYENRK